MIRLRLVLLGLALVLAGCGCGGEPQGPGSAAKPNRENQASPGIDPGPISFRAQELPFRYDRGVTGLALPLEPTGGGVGLLDYDQDGDLDLFFPQAYPLAATTTQTAHGSDVLLRNEGNQRFTDVSAEAGLVFKGYGMGATVADYDADGDPDVYVTRYGANTLWRNDGARFVDATAEAGVGCDSWSVGAAFADFDSDGDLDLYVANYFVFNPAEAPFLRDQITGDAMFGAPADFPGLADVLYRNEGSGRFRDVSDEAGIASHTGRGMGVLAADLDGDERVDFFVANDAEPNFLWRNRGDGTFEEVATSMGLAVNGAGVAEANMGIARGDTDRDGLLDLLVTHFYDEHDTLWRGERLAADAPLFYRDATFEAGLAAGSRPFTGWGTALADFDQDGWLDLIVTTGHIRPEPQQRYRYESPPLLWRGEASGRFQPASAQAGGYFQQPWMGRGLAVGDLDDDLDLDAVIVHHGKPAAVLWNETKRPGNVLMIELRGGGQNPEAIGARVTVSAGGERFIRCLDGGGSYLSSSEKTIHVGLGKAEEAASIEVRWPSGVVQRVEHLAVNRLHMVEEPGGPTVLPVAVEAIPR